MNGRVRLRPKLRIAVRADARAAAWGEWHVQAGTVHAARIALYAGSNITQRSVARSDAMAEVREPETGHVHLGAAVFRPVAAAIAHMRPLFNDGSRAA